MSQPIEQSMSMAQVREWCSLTILSPKLWRKTAEMCMSPHEMSTTRLEEDLARMRELALQDPEEDWWTWRVEQFELILKERAEAGTY